MQLIPTHQIVDALATDAAAEARITAQRTRVFFFQIILRVAVFPQQNTALFLRRQISLGKRLHVFLRVALHTDRLGGVCCRTADLGVQSLHLRNLSVDFAPVLRRDRLRIGAAAVYDAQGFRVDLCAVTHYVASLRFFFL